MSNSVVGIARQVTNKQRTALDVAAETLRAIEERDHQFAGFTHVDSDLVLAEASRIDQLITNGEDPGPLAGVPIGVKDVIDVRGLPTSYGSRSFDDYIPQRDAHSVALLRRAGALIVGKTRTSEFTWGVTTPPTRNPLNPNWIAGGSSGGAAAVVGASLVAAALGTDTGGSIRIPAALCGVTGLKPTFGVVGRSGVLPGHWLFDHVGPLAGSVSDLAVVFEALIGHDPGDPATDRPYSRGGPPSQPNRSLGSSRDVSLDGVRLGVFEDRLFEFVDETLEERFEDALELLGQRGAELTRVRLPELRFVVATLLAVDLPGSAGIHTRRLLDRPESIDPSIRHLLRFAHAIPGVIVERAHRARRRIQSSVAGLFARFDLDSLIAPGLVAPPVHFGEESTRFQRADNSEESVLDAYVRPFALASVTGQPSIVVPDGLLPKPASLQLIGRPFEDLPLLALAHQVELALQDRRTRESRSESNMT